MRIIKAKMLAAAVLFLSCSVQVHAARDSSSDLGVSVVAEVAEKHVSHIIDQDSGGAIKFSADLPSAVFGVNFSRNRFYASVVAEQSWKDDVKIVGEGILLLDRVDYSFTFGYAVLDHGSIFAGYKYGETFITSIDVINSVHSQFSFVEEGTYIGFGYTFPVDDSNAIGVSMAYAGLDGEIINHTNPFGGGGTGPNNGSGDTTGLSFAVKWVRSVTDATQFNVGYKYNQYDTESTHIDGAVVDYSSDYSYLTLGISHYF